MISHAAKGIAMLIILLCCIVCKQFRDAGTTIPNQKRVMNSPLKIPVTIEEIKKER